METNFEETLQVTSHLTRPHAGFSKMTGVLDAFMDSLFAGTLLETSTGRGQQPDPHREHSPYVDTDDTHVEQAPQQQTQSRVNYGYLHTATTTETQPETQQQPHKLPDYNAQVAFEPGKQYLAYISLRSVGNAASDVHVPFGNATSDVHVPFILRHIRTHARPQRDTRTHEDVHLNTHRYALTLALSLACHNTYARNTGANGVIETYIAAPPRAAASHSGMKYGTGSSREGYVHYCLCMHVYLMEITAPKNRRESGVM